MNKSNRQKTKTAFGFNGLITITGGSNEQFANNVMSLHAAIEGIRATEDGIKIHVSKIIVTLRLYGDADGNGFFITPVVVQTAGIFSEQDDLAQTGIDTILNASIDDVFGYQVLRSISPAKRVRCSTAAIQFGVEIQLELPQNILNLLNKESETERLQNLMMGFVGQRSVAADGIVGESQYIIEYTEQRKALTIR